MDSRDKNIVSEPLSIKTEQLIDESDIIYNTTSKYNDSKYNYEFELAIQMSIQDNWAKNKNVPISTEKYTENKNLPHNVSNTHSIPVSEVSEKTNDDIINSPKNTDELRQARLSFFNKKFNITNII